MSSGGRGSGGGFEGGALGGDRSDPARLTDGPGGDARAPEGWAIGLLRRAQPYRASVGRKQRVRMGLAQVGRRRGALVLRPAIAIAVLVGCGAVASAALGRWPALMTEAYHRLIAPLAPAAPHAIEARGARPVSERARPTDSIAAPAGSEPGVAAAVAVAEAPTVLPPASAPAPAPVSVHPRSAVSSPVPARATGASLHAFRWAASSDAGRATSAGASRATAASARARRLSAGTVGTDDTALVVEAMRALRVEGNPVRARGLLTRYLDRYPRGTLAEEALAISIEAAIAQRDGDAGALAKRYLRRYPAGHFSKLARQALDGGAPNAPN